MIKLLIMVDGILTLNNNSAIWPKTVTRQNCFIGKSGLSSDPYFNGYLDDFKLFNSAVSQSLMIQVLNIYS